MRRVLLVTEYINPPYDEGIKKTAFNLYSNLAEKYDVKVLCRYGFDHKNINIVESNRLFLSKNIKSIIEKYNPHCIIYLPFQSSTFASYVRLKILSILSGNKKVYLIALQPKILKTWEKLLLNFFKPEFALTPSPKLKSFWDKVNIRSQQLPLFTDISVFKPIEDFTKKTKLRIKYDIPTESYIISHMGHLNEGRNLRSLIPIQKSGHQVVIVSSSSTPKDARGDIELRQDLLDEGIIILDQYISNIEEIYQLSDLYIFPVVEMNSSIGMPLSILEARACAIPVLTTDYGSVKAFFGDDFGAIMYSLPKDFLSLVNMICKKNNGTYAKTNIAKLNSQYYNTIFNLIEK